MSSADRQWEVYEWFFDQQHIKGVRVDLIDEIENRISGESDPVKLRALKRLLAGQYAYVGRYQDADVIYMELDEQNPEDPLPLISLAGNKLYFQDQADEAMTAIETGD